MEALYDIPLRTIQGDLTTLRPYQGHVMLIVNVASRCGFTPQYTELETLYREYKHRKFVVLGFPCDQFLHQEPGSDEEIATFVDSCFHVTFPLFSKIWVNGSGRVPLYSYLAKHIEKRPLKLIPWNFSKILIDPKGRVLRRFLPTTSFKTLQKAIEELLPA
ncbi:MAG: glutathione peroxidase [Legionellales bacterium]|nr:glutathione peroxidase [Legionellales bacterium]